MTTVLLRLQAPMQSWGVSSDFSVRDTCREPTKSGVIGLACAALGWARDHPLHDLAALQMGVRVDREGKLMKDYHIAQQVYKAGGGKPKSAEPSNRYYLADAAFLVGLEGEREVLQIIQQALENPVWFLFLGRKAFPPSTPVYLPDGLQEKPLQQSLREYPLLVADASLPIRVCVEDEEGNILRNDVPLSFKDRRFTNRRLRMSYIDHTGEVLQEEPDEPIQN